MDNNLLWIINRTTEYIEERILEDLNLDGISENVNVSKFHLLRIWKGATSTGIMEYVRRRRAALSLIDLLSGGSIEFIASKYSFGCERSYGRVFKEEYGTTPAKWRRNPCPLCILDRFNAEFLNAAGDGLLFFRSVSVMPQLTLAGLEYEVDAEDNRINHTANRLGVDFFERHRKRIHNPVERDVYVGLTTLMDENGSLTRYMPSLMVNENSIVPEDMKKRRIRAHKYGVFTYMGPHRPEEISTDRLKEVWDFVARTWMPTVKFKLKERFSFEYINYAKCSKNYCECDLYYPMECY